MIDVTVETEKGQRRAELGTRARQLGRLLALASQRRFELLRFVDPYGDTVFNRPQMETFLLEWAELTKEATDEEVNACERVTEMGEYVRDNPHHYLKFYGD
jgi:hypothetical protein